MIITHLINGRQHGGVLPTAGDLVGRNPSSQLSLFHGDPLGGVCILLFAIA